MRQFKAINTKSKTGLVLALPLLAVAVIFADGLRAYARISLPYSDAILETVSGSWQEDGGLDETLSAHVVRLDEQGRLSGNVSAIKKGTGDTIPIGAIDVKLIQRSQEVAKTTTNANGDFQLTGTTGSIRPGSYTLCISGDDGFMAYGVQVVKSNTAPGNRSGDENAQISNQFNATLVSGVLPALDVEITAAVIPPTFTTLQKIMSGIPGGVGLNMQSTEGSQINLEESVAAGGFQVSLREDGTMVGQIARLTSNPDESDRFGEMFVFLIKDDEQVDRARVGEDGKFEFENVEPDVYGFAAAGQDGFAAMSFQAVASAEDLNSSTNASDAFQMVSESETEPKKKKSNALIVAICPPEDIPFLRREIDNLVGQPAEDVAGGAPDSTQSMLANNGQGMGGGFGFGDGSGGGGGSSATGGFDASILGWGLAIWAVSRADNNNNGNFIIGNPPNVSPF